MVKANEIEERVIMCTHCDWITAQTNEIKALLKFKSDSMENANKQRMLADISTAIDSLRELQLYFESR